MGDQILIFFFSLSLSLSLQCSLVLSRSHDLFRSLSGPFSQNIDKCRWDTVSSRTQPPLSTDLLQAQGVEHGSGHARTAIPPTIQQIANPYPS